MPPPLSAATVLPDANDKPPPAPLVPLPVLMLVAPPRPAVETPLPSVRLPVLPATVEPLLKTDRPDVPLTPPLTERMDTCPLLDPDPSPPLTVIRPPVADVLRPALVLNLDATPLVPLPTATTTPPPRPTVAIPDPTWTAPVLPIFDEPALNTSNPLAPLVPAFALRIATPPLLVAAPSPDVTNAAPPLWTVLRPATTQSAFP